MSFSTQLSAGLSALDLQVSAGQQQALGDYLQLINKWNRSFNLVADSSYSQLLSKHLLDCLAVLPHIEVQPGQVVLDVGSGAGFPGIPWAIFFPQVHFILLDSNGKKTRFLFQVQTELQLTNVRVENCRLEHYQSPGQIDIVTCRAFATLREIIEKAGPLLQQQTRLLALKGRYPQSELEELPSGFGLIAATELQVPGLSAERHLIEVGRIAATHTGIG